MASNKCRDLRDENINVEQFDQGQPVIEDGWLLGVERSAKECHNKVNTYILQKVSKQPDS
jgi:hypothetical protein